MEKTCKIILVDDHSLFRNGLRELLERCEGCRVVGEAASGEEFLAMMDCGMGLSNIASRINSLGGTFDIASAKGKGMRAAIRVNTQEEPAPLNRNHNRKRRRR